MDEVAGARASLSLFDTTSVPAIALSVPEYSVRFSLSDRIRLRPARASDRAFAEQLYLDTMLPLLTALGQGDVESLRARFARGYDQGRSRIVAAAGAGVGWIQVSPFPTGQHVDQLHLLPDWRGRGIGTVLLRRLLAHATRAGSDVVLDVIHGNRAAALYGRLGFEVTATDHEKSQMIWRPPRCPSA